MIPSKVFFKRKPQVLLFLCFICFIMYIVYFFTSKKNIPDSINSVTSQPHVLCVLVPYRDRFEELLEFVPHMSQFLIRQSIKFHIIVINHLSDGYRFNRGSTLNAGFLIMLEKFPECDYIALHDIDTLPLTDEISYSYPGDAAFHAIPPGYHPIRVYSFPTYISGILLMSKKQFERINGFGNNFWGWGFEDIDFHGRLMKYFIQINRPSELSTNHTNSFKHTQRKSKPRDIPWCRNQVAAATGRDRTDHTGLSDVNYTISSENMLIIDGYPVSLFNINIKCNFEITPWCRPLCLDNITTSKTMWDWDEIDVKNRLQFLSKNLDSNGFSEWKQILNNLK